MSEKKVVCSCGSVMEELLGRYRCIDCMSRRKYTVCYESPVLRATPGRFSVSEMWGGPVFPDADIETVVANDRGELVFKIRPVNG